MLWLIGHDAGSEVGGGGAEPLRDGMGADPRLCLFPRHSQIHLCLGHGIIDGQPDTVTVIREPVGSGVTDIAHDNAFLCRNGDGKSARTNRTRFAHHSLVRLSECSLEEGDDVIVVGWHPLVHCRRQVIARGVRCDSGAFLCTLGRRDTISDDKDDMTPRTVDAEGCRVLVRFMT